MEFDEHGINWQHAETITLLMNLYRTLESDHLSISQMKKQLEHRFSVIKYKIDDKIKKLDCRQNQLIQLEEQCNIKLDVLADKQDELLKIIDRCKFDNNYII